MPLISGDYQLESELNENSLDINNIILKLIYKSQKNLPFSLNVKDLAKILPHSNTKIYLMLESGELPARKIGGKWVISRDYFLAWYYGVDINKAKSFKIM